MKVLLSSLAENPCSGSLSRVILAEQKYWIEQRQKAYLKQIAEGMDFDPNSGGRCIYHALAGMLAGEDYGVRFSVQAGSAYWQYRICKEGTDTFGYQWNLQQANEALKQERLPDMHVWLMTEFPQEEWLVDFSAPAFKEACPDVWEIEGYDHPIWIPIGQGIQQRCCYQEYTEATQLAVRLMDHGLKVLYRCQE